MALNAYGTFLAEHKGDGQNESLQIIRIAVDLQARGIILLLDKEEKVECFPAPLLDLVQVDFKPSEFNSCYTEAVGMYKDIKNRDGSSVEAPTPEKSNFAKQLDVRVFAQAVTSARLLEPNRFYRFLGGNLEAFLEAHLSHQLVNSMMKTEVFLAHGLHVETIWEGATKSRGLNNCDAVAALVFENESLVPFLFVELERKDRSNDRHKDTVKLPGGMKQVLVGLVKALVARGVDKSEILKLRVFGALIDRRSVKFCVMRPVIFQDDSVAYSLRYLQDLEVILFNSEHKFQPNITIPALHKYFEVVLSIAKESEGIVQGILNSIDAVAISKQQLNLRELPESKKKNSSRADTTPAKDKRKNVQPRHFGGDSSECNRLPTATLVQRFLEIQNLAIEGKLLHGVSLNAAVSVACLRHHRVLVSKCNGRGDCEVDALTLLISQSRMMGMVDFPCVELFEYERFPTSGGYVMVQEQLVARDPNLSKPLHLTALEYTQDIIKALILLHVCGIVHRDIAPKHIMYSHLHQRWVLLDFDCCGFVSIHAPKLFSGKVGTDGFIAPEVLQVSDQGYGCSADVWSFGQVLKQQLSVDGMWGSRLNSKALSAVWSVIAGVSEGFLSKHYNLLDSLQQVQTCIETVVSAKGNVLQSMSVNTIVDR
jgi:hypothetical protein